MAYTYPFKVVDEKTKKAVWAKGRPIEKDKNGKSWDSAIWRWDKCGAVMKFSEHGNRK